jgi:hypothetical protein
MDINMFTSAIKIKQVLMDKKLSDKIRRIMRYNLGHKLDFNAPDLRAHVDGILKENLFRKFRKAVPYFYYLEGRSWFCNNPRLQHLLLEVVNKGLGQQVNVTAGDFALHLDCLLYRDTANKFPLYAKYIRNAEYAGRFRLHDNPTLDKMFYDAVKAGLGGDINVTAGDIRLHLDCLMYRNEANKYPLYEKYITDAWYMGRFRLHDNPTLDKLFYDAVEAGFGDEIDVRAADIRSHLDCLIHEDDRFYIFRKYVPDFEYLETRSWFMRSTELQDKLFKVIELGCGPLIDTTAGNFRKHLDDFILC